MQSRPAEQFHGVLLQIKIAGQNCFDVARIGVLLHWIGELYDAAELVAVAIVRIGQDELRVVLSGHVTNLRLRAHTNCELEHRLPFAPSQSPDT